MKISNQNSRYNSSSRVHISYGQHDREESAFSTGSAHMSFAKLDSGITKSSLWSEALHVRIVFLSFLAEKDELGFVSGSRSGMIRVCNVTPEQFDNAIEILSSPDPDSKSKEFEGRRISKCDGGWVVLNSDKYRLPEDEKKENRKEYMRNYMSEYRKNDVNVNKSLHEFTDINKEFTSVSASVSVSVSEIEEIYSLYPTKDINHDNQSTGKSSKNKQKIKKILETKYPLKKAVEFYLSECKRTKCYLKNFSTFLNNLPDESTLDEKPVQQHEQQKKNRDFAYISPYDMEK